MKDVKVMKKGWFLSAVVLMMLMFVIGKVDAKAANVIHRYTSGDITWTLYDDGLLSMKKATGDSDIDYANFYRWEDYISAVKKGVIDSRETLINELYGQNYPVPSNF